jgi:hypothetical protein
MGSIYLNAWAFAVAIYQGSPKPNFVVKAKVPTLSRLIMSLLGNSVNQIQILIETVKR